MRHELGGTARPWTQGRLARLLSLPQVVGEVWGGAGNDTGDDVQGLRNQVPSWQALWHVPFISFSHHAHSRRKQ